MYGPRALGTAYDNPGILWLRERQNDSYDHQGYNIGPTLDMIGAVW